MSGNGFLFGETFAPCRYSCWIGMCCLNLESEWSRKGHCVLADALADTFYIAHVVTVVTLELRPPMIQLKLSDEMLIVCLRFRNTSSSLLALSRRLCSLTTRMVLAVVLLPSSSARLTPLPRLPGSLTASWLMAAP